MPRATPSVAPAGAEGPERCYHRPPRLVRALPALRAREHAFREEGVESFEPAAEVHESKLGDPGGAIEVYRNLLVVEPKHRRALTDLGRPTRRSATGRTSRRMKSRLAELAPTKRASSQELVKLGDFSPPRTAIRSPPLTYEKAVDRSHERRGLGGDPAHGGRRGRHHARHRAPGAAESDTGDPAPARGSASSWRASRWEQATRTRRASRMRRRSAPTLSNEAAAVFMLDAYTADESAGPRRRRLRAARQRGVRDRDQDALFIRPPADARIAAALGDADRALTASMAAL